MIPIRPDAPWGLWGTSRILLLCAVPCSSAATAEPRQAWIASRGVNAERGGGRGADLKFTHLTTKDGLSQGYVVDILQDRRGFMWFATRDGLNRYDGYTFVVYKHDPNDPGSLSSSFIQDLMEDDHGYLWVATNNGVNRFDPTTERCTRYLHDPNDPGTLGGASVKSVAQDRHGHLWFGTEDGGLDRLDPGLGTFTHHRNDSDGRFVGRITQVIDGPPRGRLVHGRARPVPRERAGQTNHPSSGSRQGPQRRQRVRRRSGRPVVAGQFARRGAREIRPADRAR